MHWEYIRKRATSASGGVKSEVVNSLPSRETGHNAVHVHVTDSRLDSQVTDLHILGLGFPAISWPLADVKATRHT
jgi:hypothetical protein